MTMGAAKLTKLFLSSIRRDGVKAQLVRTDLAALGAAQHKGWALGDHRFREKIEKLSGRGAAPLPKGRPRKDNGV